MLSGAKHFVWVNLESSRVSFRSIGFPVCFFFSPPMTIAFLKPVFKGLAIGAEVEFEMK